MKVCLRSKYIRVMDKEIDIVFAAVCLPIESSFARFKSIVWHRCSGRVISYAHIFSSERCVQSYMLELCDTHDRSSHKQKRSMLFYDIFCLRPLQIKLRNTIARGRWRIAHADECSAEVNALLFSRSAWLCCVELAGDQRILIGVGNVIVHERIFSPTMTVADVEASHLWLRKRVFPKLLREKSFLHDTYASCSNVSADAKILLFVQEKFASAICQVFDGCKWVEMIVIRDSNVDKILQAHSKSQKHRNLRIVENVVAHLSMLCVFFCIIYAIYGCYRLFNAYSDYAECAKKAQTLSLRDSNILKYRKFIATSKHPSYLLKKAIDCIQKSSGMTKLMYENGEWRVINA